MKHRKIKLEEYNELSKADMQAEEVYSTSTSGTGSGGDSGANSGTGTSTDPLIMPECRGLREGSQCVASGAQGKCQYMKVKEGIFIQDTKVVLACINDAAGSGTNVTELDRRERACVGKKYGDECHFLDDNATSNSGKCFYNRYGLGTGILRCADRDYRNE
ncbi:MAG: hypothetical protein HDR86_00695 [Bacteroides sp.]|nr:hypothetical protein [Bacteroides sp.]